MVSSQTVLLTVLAVAVAVTVSLLAALAAGLLALAEGAGTAGAVSRGCVVFAATLTLLALMVTTLGDLLG